MRRVALLRPTVLRNACILHLCVLVLVRVLRDADDFNDWDLITFLNANAFDSLWQLLKRPDVHFRNPFSFPLYNVGSESVPSILMFRLLGHVSLYWSNVIVILVYDTLFEASGEGSARAGTDRRSGLGPRR